MGFQNDLRHGMGYEGANAGAGIGPSPAIWQQFSRDFDTAKVRSYELDFTVQHPTFASATAQNGLITYQDTGVTIGPSTTADDGLLIAANDADNDEGSIGGQTQVPWTVSDTASEARLLAFEASVKKTAVGADGTALFVGLMSAGQVAANALVDDSGAVKNTNYIGFSVLQDAGSSVDAVYKVTGETAGSVEADCATMVADTFMKLGFVYDPAAPASQRVSFYVDGTNIGSYVTATDIAAATFPDSVDLTWAFLTKKGEAAVNPANLRWVRIAQYR